VLGGFLGAGKTTLVNALLREARGLRLAVLVNDFGAVNIDAALIEGAAAEGVVALTNGCVCCAVGDDLAAGSPPCWAGARAGPHPGRGERRRRPGPRWRRSPGSTRAAPGRGGGAGGCSQRGGAADGTRASRTRCGGSCARPTCWC
jgi:hypothetical protein